MEKQPETEIWKVIEGCDEFYEISNLGNVRSWKSGSQGRRTTPKMLKQTIDKYGYFMVNLPSVIKGKYTVQRVHRIVAAYFLDGRNKQNRDIIDHIDNDKSNNKASNLQFIPLRENSTKDKKRRSELSGVYVSKQNSYYSQIYVNNKKIWLGTFKTKEEASEAYQSKLKEISI